MDAFQTQLNTIALFCKAAEVGSFTAAANVMGLTPAAVSRGVGRLEDRLGVKLFNRTTRSMSLTDAGRSYFEQCRDAMGQIDEAEKALSGQQLEPRGLLRISMPSVYGQYRFLPQMTEFRRLHPHIELELNISNRNIDFVEEGYDLAIRQGTPPDSRLVARKLEDARVGIYASPAYLKRCGEPLTLEALQSEQHTLLPFLLPSTGKPMPWIVLNNGKALELAPKSDVKVTDEPLGCVTLARSGLGLVQTFAWVAQTYQGELVEVLQQHAGRTRPYYLLHPHNRHLPARVRALINFYC